MADPILISWQLLDDEGNKRAYVQHVASTATEAQIQAYITAHGPKLDDVTGCQPLKVTVTKPYTLPAVKGAPLADHPVNHGGLIKFSATGTAFTYGSWVPGYDQTEVDAGQIVDADDTATFLASMLGGESQVTLTDSRGNALSAFLGGEQRDRK